MEEERTVTEKQLPEKSPEPGFSYFEIQAHWGVTKHMGGLKATEELNELATHELARNIADAGGTPYFSTSRRTSPVTS